MNVEHPEGLPDKFAATVKVGPKGQVVIPKGARDLFDIKPGDSLLLLADVEGGIALLRQELLDQIVAQAMPGGRPGPGPVPPAE
ncbi:AbrB/MazE/SpoVT family DNA-binding domain-containing protein [Nigerium massiliense]|uniref:AbrB/MazE/SpoVT family DNA-binding domain-containing protein n=1 Tax=Nigerium massiliense TaxID=1522317 RepID=UPI00058B0B1E|nr:AbrB/MazE/SpoVT family DNA-binding domain-containing protein [Nigerium massiliense]